MTAHVRRRNERLTIGSIITIVIFLIGGLWGGIRWYKKVDTNIGEIKTIAKDNRDDVGDLKKCERDSTISLAELKTTIKNIRERLDKLEYKVDRRP